MKATTAIIVSTIIAFAPMPGMAASAMQECLIASLETADDNATVGSLRNLCNAKVTAPAPEEEETLALQYIRSDADVENRRYIISAHNQNYILPFTYNSEFNREPWIQATTPENANAFRDEEAVFQVSAKYPLYRNLFSRNTDLYFGYTQKSWWQVYTNEAELSAPFRESNYEPEVFARYYGGPDLPRFGRVSVVDFGIVHQSNGRADISDGALNRSWDRVMARAVLDWDQFALMVRGWWAFAESDDNPNLYQYMGYGDVRAVWAPNKHTFGLMFRPGTREVAVEASWSWQITDVVRLYAQYYRGYGESLLDYNAETNRFGIGIMMTDLLMNY